MKVQSLRARLILIILTPLLLISIAAATWQFTNTTKRAEEIFDRGLLSTALAISRDVALSGGDALSSPTRTLINDTSGGEVFYHVYAPDGVFITGYATPPPLPTKLRDDLNEPIYYTSVYQGRDVRVLRFLDATTIDGVSGLFTITVWQEMRIRNSFIRDVVARAISVIALLLLSVALIVWFGVGIGLRPLLDLQDAIAKRTPNDLEPIRRNVPVETQGIVSTLNALLDRVSRRISSKDEFISNAAHQLRNPIAGVLALAEAVENAPTPKAAKLRSSELLVAARDATHLTNQLLSFERAKGSDTDHSGTQLELNGLIENSISRFSAQKINQSVDLIWTPSDTAIQINGDEIMLQEAILNLLTNAVVHGGSNITQVNVDTQIRGNFARICVQDNGVGIPSEARELAVGRFSQANAGPGSGLGLPIASQVMENHGGRLMIENSDKGARIVCELPI